MDLLILVVTCAINLMLGFFVLLRDTRKVYTRLFVLVSVMTSIWIVANYFTNNHIGDLTVTNIANKLAFVGGFGLLFAELLFTYSFPAKREIPTHEKAFLVVFAGSMFGLSLTESVAGVASLNTKNELVFSVGGLTWIYILGFIITIILMTRNLWTVSRGQSSLKVRQARLILLAFGTTAFAGLLLNVITPALTDNWSSTKYTPLVTIILVAVITYAIVRHKLFDIRLAVARGMGYVLLLITLFAIYTGALFIVTQLLFANDMNDVSIRQTVVYFIFAVLLAITYNPLKLFFDRITDKIFYRQDYTFQETLSRFSDVVANEIDLKHLSEDVVDVLFNTIKPEFVYLHVRPHRNQVARKIFLGKSPGLLDSQVMKMIDKYMYHVIIVDYMNESNEALQAALNNMRISVIIRLETAHEKIGYLVLGPKLNGTAYSSKEVPFFRGIGNELSLALQNSLRFEEIQGFTETLQARIDAATRRLRSSNHKLRQLDVAKDEFVSMASHQLRTPLTSVKGYISMVLEGDVGKITATQRKLLGEAFTSSERMVHLISDFLNVSRLQTGKFVLEKRRVDLAKIATQEVDSLQTTARAHGLTLQYHAPSYFPLLYLDESKIRQVLMNFIDNAIYYSQEGTTITIRLGVEDGSAVLEVHDTGIGVPKEEQAHLFTKFFRATNARKQRPDGTGVGLFLAKKVVVAHGGDIVFKSVENAGSTFGLRLPIKKLSTAPTESTEKLGK